MPRSVSAPKVKARSSSRVTASGDAARVEKGGDVTAARRVRTSPNAAGTRCAAAEERQHTPAVDPSRELAAQLRRPLGGPVAVRVDRDGEQVEAGDDLWSEVVSGDAGLAGERSAPGGGGSEEGSVPAPSGGLGPIPPSVVDEHDRLGCADLDLGALTKALGGDESVVIRLIQDYLNLLDERLPDIRRYLRSEQTDAARVALLSLETTTAMFGVPAPVAAISGLRAKVGYRPTPELLDQLTGVAAVLRGLRERLGIELLRRAATVLAAAQRCESASR